MRCECADPGCPVHRGADCTRKANALLRRIDMDDESGEYMCESCAEDALESGVFAVTCEREQR
jgi:hypothetical protein